MSFTALVAATRLMKQTQETARGRMTSDIGVGIPVPALAAWEVGSAVASAVDHLLQDVALRAADESDDRDFANPFESPEAADAEYIITLLTALRDAFDCAGPGATTAAAAATPELLPRLRSIIVIAPMLVRAAAARAAAPIMTAVLAASATPHAAPGPEHQHFAPPPPPEALTLKVRRCRLTPRLTQG